MSQEHFLQIMMKDMKVLGNNLRIKLNPVRFILSEALIIEPDWHSNATIFNKA